MNESSSGVNRSSILARLKLCRHCRERKFIRDFGHPRHRICTQCRRNRNTVQSGFSVIAGVITPHSDYARAQLYYNTKDNLPLTNGLTTGDSARKKYYRERARNIAAAKRDAENRARQRQGLPMKAPKIPADPRTALKWCRHCQRSLSIFKFASPNVRICMNCDGPSLGIGG